MIRQRGTRRCLHLEHRGESSGDRLVLATELLRSGRPADAEREVREVLRLQPEWAAAQLLMGQALAAQGQWQPAWRHFELVTRLAAADPVGWQSLAEAMRQCGQLERALRAIRVAERCNAKDAAVHLIRGRILRGLDRHAEAWQAFEQSIALEPGSRATLLEAAMVARQLGSLAEAIRCAKTAAQLDPLHEDTRILLGDLLSDLGRDEEAIRHYFAAVELSPWSPAARSRIGQFFLERKLWRQAFNAFMVNLVRQNESPADHVGIGRIYLHTQRYEEAEMAFRAAAATSDLPEVQSFRDGADAAARFLRFGDVHAALGDPAAAMAAYSMPCEPAMVGAARYKMAEAAVAQGRLAEGLALYREALAAGADAGRCHHQIAQCLFAGGDYEAARRELDASIAAGFATSTAFLNRAEAHRASGETGAARADLVKAVELEQDLEIARRRLRLLAGSGIDGLAQKLLWRAAAEVPLHGPYILVAGVDGGLMLLSATLLEPIRLLDRAELQRARAGGGLELGGQTIPMRDLSELLPERRSAPRKSDRARIPDQDLAPVLVHGGEGGRAALTVHRIVGRPRRYRLHGGPSRPGVSFTAVVGDRVVEVVEKPLALQQGRGCGSADPAAAGWAAWHGEIRAGQGADGPGG
jgi:tetratricopeptide (TPR) repeat protein